MEEVKKIEVLILQSIGGLKFNYRANQVVALPEAVALAWKEKGLCKLVEDKKTEVITHPETTETTSSDNTPITGELPLDFPNREILIENNLDTIEKVKEFGDLTDINGIGPKSAANILEALNQ